LKEKENERRIFSSRFEGVYERTNELIIQAFSEYLTANSTAKHCSFPLRFKDMANIHEKNSSMKTIEI